MNTKKILCFAAHPDDLEFGCTVTLRRFIEQGYQVFFTIITNGENGFKTAELPAEERAKTRKLEQKNAAKKLGVKEVYFLDYRDGFLTYTEELRRQLVEQIKTIQPEIVFSFDPANQNYDSLNLYHRDHRVVAEAVFDACFAAKNLWMYPDPAHRINKLYFYATQQPNYFEDISGLIDFKLDVLACHQSQFPDFSKVEHYVKKVISKTNPEMEHSEPFRIIEVKQHT